MKDNPTGRKPFTKSRLIKELSWSCELPQTTVKALLENLTGIARREACNTFVLPGICKLEVVRRKPRKVRNPRTGETFMLPEREALRITAPRSLKVACARVIEPLPAQEEPVAPAEAEPTAAPETPAAPAAAEPAEPMEEAVAQAEAAAVEPAAPAEEAAATEALAVEAALVEETGEQAAATAAEESVAETVVEPAPAPEATAEPEAVEPPPAIDPNALISFRCSRCHQEVEATGDLVGLETECPTCGNLIVVPAQSESGTIHDANGSDGEDGPARHAQTVSSQEAESLSPEKLKGLTIRIDVGELGLNNPQKAEEDEPQSDQMVSFVCMTCKQEIEASRDMAGETTACPNCGAPLIVPSESTANTLHSASQETDAKTVKAMKGRTMRIDLGEDF